MSKLKEEYDRLTDESKKIIKKIEFLEQDEAVKEYLALKAKNEKLFGRAFFLYEGVKCEEYDDCRHILVCSKIDGNRYEGRTRKSYGCIKCGLDNSVLDSNKESLPLDKKIMYSYLRKNYIEGIRTGISCDLSLAQAIYFKIRQAHPNIDDKMAIKYFEIALADIRNIPVNDARKISRAKRLSLNVDFNNWNSTH